MSSNAFYHKNHRVSLGMKCALAIMRRDFPAGMRVDGLNAAAHKLADRLHHPGALGRSYGRRHRVLKDAVGTAIARGFLEFTEGNLVITGKGVRISVGTRRTRLAAA